MGFREGRLGRTVHYVLDKVDEFSGAPQCRPAVVTSEFPPHLLNLVVTMDGTNDPLQLYGDAPDHRHGHRDDTEDFMAPDMPKAVSPLHIWRTSIDHNVAKQPSTWHDADECEPDVEANTPATASSTAPVGVTETEKAPSAEVPGGGVPTPGGVGVGVGAPDDNASDGKSPEPASV